MNGDYLIHLGGSILAVLAVCGLAAWMKIARPAPRLDPLSARQMLAEEYPDETVTGLWIAPDQSAVVARTAAQTALILFRLGDGLVARECAWRQIAEARRLAAGVRLAIKDVGVSHVDIRLDPATAWPPQI